MDRDEAKKWFGTPEMSHYRENLLEHMFISELLQVCAFERGQKVEVLRTEVDEYGYDLVLETDDEPPVVRHVQLKTRKKGGGGRGVTVNADLMRHEGWCVVWFDWDLDPLTWDLDPSARRLELSYRWLGNLPGESSVVLPGGEAKMQELKRSHFKARDDGSGFDAREMASMLFGPPPGFTPSGS